MEELQPILFAPFIMGTQEAEINDESIKHKLLQVHYIDVPQPTKDMTISELDANKDMVIQVVDNQYNIILNHIKIAADRIKINDNCYITAKALIWPQLECNTIDAQQCVVNNSIKVNNSSEIKQLTTSTLFTSEINFPKNIQLSMGESGILCTSNVNGLVLDNCKIYSNNLYIESSNSIDVYDTIAGWEVEIAEHKAHNGPYAILGNKYAQSDEATILGYIFQYNNYVTGYFDNRNVEKIKDQFDEIYTLGDIDGPAESLIIRTQYGEKNNTCIIIDCNMFGKVIFTITELNDNLQDSDNWSYFVYTIKEKN